MFKAILAFNFVGIGLFKALFKAYSEFRNVLHDVQFGFLGPWGFGLGDYNCAAPSLNCDWGLYFHV